MPRACHAFHPSDGRLVTGQMERVLTGMQSFRDDMTVAMSFASRADVSSGAAAAVQRSPQSRPVQLRTRVTRLEAKQGNGG